MNHWWSLTTAIWIGSVGGGSIGLLGALLGVAGSLFVPRGKGRTIVVGGGLVLATVGVCALVLGIVAAVTGQPYHVFYPLLLGGFVTALVFGMLTPMMAARYRAVEMRKIEAENLRRG